MLEFAATDRFEIRARLGQGGMGTVYRAFDRELEVEVALKTLERQGGAALLRFKHEFRALQDLEHRNLVNLGELFEADGRWFFTMELLSGVDFLTYVGGRPVPLPAASRATIVSRGAAQSGAAGGAPVGRLAFHEDRLRSALPQLALGLRALHDAGMVHRDVKPSNILVEEDGRLVLLDFGLVADNAAEPIGGRDELAGTVVYMSPEQAGGMVPEPASDMYSVGVMLYEVLTGRVPFDGEAMDVLIAKQSHEPVPPGLLAPGIPADLEQLCTSLLDIAPRERPSAREVLEHFDADASAASVRASPGAGAALVGREAELATLEAVFANVRAGAARAVLVIGESGVGKSALVRAMTARQARRGALAFAGRCYERESVPFKGFDGVVDSLAAHLGRLPEAVRAELVPADAHVLVRTFPALTSVLPRGPRRMAPADPVQARALVFSTLRALLQAVAARDPVIVRIDDVQWADGDSLVLLRELLTPPAPPVLFLLTARAVEDLDLDALPGASALALEPLPPAAATDLARHLLQRGGGAASATSAEAVAAEADGHPLYIAELVRHALEHPSTETRPRLEDAIQLRAVGLADDARRVLELVSLAAGPIPLHAVQLAADIEPRELARHVSALRVSSLVRCTGSGRDQLIEPYHDHVRRGMIADLDDDIARAHHERLGAALIEVGGTAELLLHHLEAAGHRAEAARRAADAAERAHESLAFVRAAELLRTAIRLGEHTPEALRGLQRRLGDACAHAGRGVEAADAYLLAADGASPNVALECRALASHFLVATGHHERGVATLRSVLEELDISLPGSTAGGVASILWGRASLSLRRRRYTERRVEDIPTSELIRLDVLEAVSECLGSVDAVLTAALQLRHVRMALRVGEPSRVARALAFEAVLTALQGQRFVQTARERFDAALSMLARTGKPISSIAYRMMELENFDGVLDYLAGQFDTAADKLLAVEESWSASPGVNLVEVNTFRMILVGSLRELGRFGRWQRLHPRFVRDAEARGDLLARTSLRRVGAILFLARDRSDLARAELEHTAWPAPTEHFHMQHWYELQARAEIALYEGSLEDIAEWVLERLHRITRSLVYRTQAMRYNADSLAARVHLGLAATRADSLDRARRLTARLRRERVPHVAAWADLLDAGIAAREDDRGRASQLLDRAMHEADDRNLGFVGAVARLRAAELGPEGFRAERLRAAAAKWQRREGVVNLASMARIIAPAPG